MVSLSQINIRLYLITLIVQLNYWILYLMKYYSVGYYKVDEVYNALHDVDDKTRED